MQAWPTWTDVLACFVVASGRVSKETCQARVACAILVLKALAHEKQGRETEENHRFVDALRGCLGLDPIYEATGPRHNRGEQVTLQRFYLGVHVERPDGRTGRAPIMR